MSARPRLAGVLGWPIGHSLSPVLHDYWLKQHVIAGAYIPLNVPPKDLAQAVAVLSQAAFVGVNVTVPHKEAAFALLSKCDDDARVTGAVNTLVFEGGLMRGLNTDVPGFSASLRDAFGKTAARRGPAVVLGAGGAARAVVLALARAGAAEIRLVNRGRKRAEKLAADLKSAPIRLLDWGDWDKAFIHAHLLVNATSLGMKDQPPLDFSLDALAPEAAVADIVYNPLETGLLARARERGHATMDGLGMLMHQGAASFAAWFGVTPEVTPALRAELQRALLRG